MTTILIIAAVVVCWVGLAVLICLGIDYTMPLQSSHDDNDSNYGYYP